PSQHSSRAPSLLHLLSFLSPSTSVFLSCALAVRLPPCPTLFPYTTLFRSGIGTRSCGPDVRPEHQLRPEPQRRADRPRTQLVLGDRKSTRLNSSHVSISYAVFCLKKKKRTRLQTSHV